MNTWIHDFGNFKMVLDRNDIDISKQIEENGWYTDEKLETEAFRAHIKKGMNFLDLGANIGFYTLYGRSLIGPSGKIFSFEPHPNNVDFIKSSIKLNSFENISVIEAAISDFDGKTTLHEAPDDNSEHSLIDLDFDSNGGNKKSLEVNVITIDSFLEKLGDFKVDFIKMDIEGSEFNAMKGMSKILNENRHLILMTEFWPNGLKLNGKDPKEFLDTLQANHFVIHLIDSQKNEVCSINPDELMGLNQARFENTTDKFMKKWGWYTNLICIK